MQHTYVFAIMKHSVIPNLKIHSEFHTKSPHTLNHIILRFLPSFIPPLSRLQCHPNTSWLSADRPTTSLQCGGANNPRNHTMIASLAPGQPVTVRWSSRTHSILHSATRTRKITI